MKISKVFVPSSIFCSFHHLFIFSIKFFDKNDKNVGKFYSEDFSSYKEFLKSIVVPETAVRFSIAYSSHFYKHDIRRTILVIKDGFLL